MVWTKNDDKLSDHRKFLAAGAAAVGVWTFGQSYVGRNLTDGFIPLQAAKSLAFSLGAGEKEIRRLIEVGLWEQDPLGYRIHDFLDYNPSRAEVEELARLKSIAGRRGGLASAQARAKAPPQAPAQANGKQVLKQNPSRVQAEFNPEPEPVPVVVTEGTGREGNPAPEPRGDSPPATAPGSPRNPPEPGDDEIPVLGRDFSLADVAREVGLPPPLVGVTGRFKPPPPEVIAANVAKQKAAIQKIIDAEASRKAELARPSPDPSEEEEIQSPPPQHEEEPDPDEPDWDQIAAMTSSQDEDDQ